VQDNDDDAHHLTNERQPGFHKYGMAQLSIHSVYSVGKHAVGSTDQLLQWVREVNQVQLVAGSGVVDGDIVTRLKGSTLSIGRICNAATDGPLRAFKDWNSNIVILNRLVKYEEYVICTIRCWKNSSVYFDVLLPLKIARFLLTVENSISSRRN
jgi:hypothetical protein